MASRSIQNIKKSLMTGVSFMLPMVVAGGLLMAIAKIAGGALVGNSPESIPGIINTIGGVAMSLVVPILTAYVAFAICDRPGIAPGLIVGSIALTIKAGFLGGILGGFLVGYTVLYLKKMIKLPANFQGLMPIIILPTLTTLIVGLIMFTMIGKPLAALQDMVLNWLKSMQGGSKFILGSIIGGMMGFDLGGPINKTASFFCNGLLAEGVYGPTACKIIGGMTPPLGVALSVFIAKNRYTKQEWDAAKAALPLGLCFITEGVLPFAASDPLRVIPACCIGSAVSSGLALAWGAGSKIPHGGIFVVPLMDNPLMFIAALCIGTVVTATILTVLKPVLPVDAEAKEEVVDEDFDVEIKDF
jgi:PTS system fructose-specific IIC component